MKATIALSSITALREHPVVDCGGRVAAVVSNVLTQNLEGLSRQIRISTAWGTPNVVSVPIQALEDLPQLH
jgi:hypothetical protein